jgi:hypothetical protein
MASSLRTDERESGTGQDTAKGCVHVPPRYLLRLAGHSGTMSRHVPLCPAPPPRGGPATGVLLRGRSLALGAANKYGGAA